MAAHALWSNDTEIEFFKKALSNFASPEQLFYKWDGEYLAYIPKPEKRKKPTLQSRNSLIGRFTEKWCKDIFSPIARRFNLYAINGMECEEFGLVNLSRADLAFCTVDSLKQRPENIKLIFEVKMSIVSNYKYDEQTKKLSFIGDYKTHTGNPSLLRSDSMLKATGKSINIRVSHPTAANIPLIVLGNSPITEYYVDKVDILKTSGIIQGFLSLNPKPTELEYIKNSPKLGFQTILSIEQLQNFLGEIIEKELNFFSSMISKVDLGKIISLASKEKTDIEKAEKFLALIKG